MFLSRSIPPLKWRATRLALRTAWTGSKVTANKYLDELKTESMEDLQSAKSQDILSRTKVITCEKECDKIVTEIMRKGDPVAVDMEGVQEGVTGMIQVCDSDRNISLFRTAKNPSLYRSGRLADLLESPHIVKILHASSVDCMSVYSDKVKMWNIYDTCVAHKIFQYQTYGINITGTPQIGFNDLCDFCGLEQNPLKKKAKNLLWKMLTFNRVLVELEDLGPELILYSAWDVEPLHLIRDTMDTLIDPDYRHLVQQVSDFDLIRPIDANLVKKKRANLKNVENCGVFLSNLGDKVRKPDIYQFVSTELGHKHVYFSDSHHASNIILDSRQNALDFYKLYSKKRLPRNLGPKAKISLVINAHPTEVGEAIVEKDQEADRDDSWVTNPKLCAEMVDIIIDAKAPVAIDFLKMPTSLVIEMYIGVMPCIKIAVTTELVTEGRLGDLLSCADVPKIMLRLDTDSVHVMLKQLAVNGVYMKNVFELDSAWKSLDYLHHGQSFFKMGFSNIQKICSALGIERDTSGLVSKLDWYLLCYTHLASVIPHSFQKILAERAAVELDIGTGQDLAFNKNMRRQLKDKIDLHCLHFRVSGSKSKKDEMSTLKNYILKYLVTKNFVMLNYMEVERSAIVELQSRGQVVVVLDDFQNRTFDIGNLNVAITTPHILKELLEKPPVKPVLMEKLRSEIAKDLVKLKDGGLLDILHKKTPPGTTVPSKEML